MGYKKMSKGISFADLAVAKSLEHNRSLKMMNRINKVVNWKNVEAMLQEYYEACLSGCLPRQRNVDRVTLATLQDVPTPPRTAPHRWAQPRARRSPARCQMRPSAKTYG